MVGSLPGDIHQHQPLSIRISMQVSNNMSRRLGEGPVYNAGRASTTDANASREDGYLYPFASLIPAQARTASRRSSMTVQDMLNPSDEEPRRSSQARSSQSSDNDSERGSPSSSTHSSVHRHGHSRHGATPSRGSRRSQNRSSRQPTRRAIRRTSPSSSGQDSSEKEKRAFRPKYTPEQTHFIW